SLYKLAQAYSSSATLSWSTTGLAPGTYRFSVWVRDASSAGTFSNHSGRWDAYNAAVAHAVTPTCKAVIDSAVPASAAKAGTTVKITAIASGCGKPLYQFCTLAPGASLYTVAQSYSTSPVLTWTTSGRPKGTYRITVWARDAGSTGVSGNAYGRWDAYNAHLLFSLT